MKGSEGKIMKKIAAMLADGFEEVEAFAVIDLLRRADIEITMISIMENCNKVNGAHGIIVVADALIEDIDFNNYDGIFLPGGMPGTNNLDKCNELCDIINDFNNQGKLLTAICAAPKIYGRLGILKGKKATCFPGFERDLLGAEVLCEKVVEDGNIITSRGMGTAIDLGLKLVARLKSDGEAMELGKTIQYVS